MSSLGAKGQTTNQLVGYINKLFRSEKKEHKNRRN